MTEAKNRTHLTPEEVQEFINLGVDFGETACNWLQYTPQGVPDCIIYSPNLYVRDMIGEDTWTDPNHKVLPAPNLQEVLEVLPKKIEYDGSKCWLITSYTNQNEWAIGYECMEHQSGKYYNITGLIHEYSANLLCATIDLLRWVCKNHPETLTTKTK